MTNGQSHPARFFFVHVQKAAGTSILARLRHHFASQEIYPDATDLTEDPSVPTLLVSHLRQRYELRRNDIRVVTGHFPLRTTELLGDQFVTMTVLREPVERTLSFLRHYQAMTPEDRNRPLEEIYEDDIRFHGLIHNHMVKMFSLSPDEMGQGDGVMTRINTFDDARLEAAKANLATVDVVGFDDDVEAFCATISEHFGWELGPPVRANRTAPEVVPPSLRDRIVADNAADIDFYHHARARHHQDA